MASKLARRILMLSISATDAVATDQNNARSRISTANSSRRAAVSFLESARPTMGLAGSSTTAAAYTSPAKGPRPASSVPQINRLSDNTGRYSFGRWALRQKRQNRFGYTGFVVH